MSAVLKVKNLCKIYNEMPVVNEVSYELAPNSVVALVGPNGAGKTTCFNMLHGQIKHDAGEIWLGDKEISKLSPRERLKLGIARTFQITKAFVSMSVLENVQVAILAYRGELKSWLRPLGKRHAEEAFHILGLVGIAQLANSECTTLAYGDLKRVEFAIGLASRPQLLLLDEPTAGMSTSDRYALMESVVGIAKQFNNTILFTEHDMDVVFRHSERILVMNQGRLIADGEPEDVRANELVREVYFGSGEF